VLFATNFGQKHNPAWYYNLKANPECIVQRRGNKSAFLAREEAGDEYERYWQLGVSYYEGYALYRECAGHRHLPIMVLEPIQSR
jgi:deazaflavin-dependent oxidoreductase (nitroreductase family)